MNSKIQRGCLCAAFAFLLGSCANPKDSEEYKSLYKDVAILKNEILSLEQEIADKESQSLRIDMLKKDLEGLESQFAGIVADDERRQMVVQAIGFDACKRFATAMEASVGEVEVDQFWDNVDARLSPEDRILGEFVVFDYYPAWKQKYNKELEATGCAEEAEKEFYAQCESFDKLALNKNPEAFRGRCLKGTVRIAQFDSNTGPCAFQGYLGGGYEVRAQFGQTLDPTTHGDQTDCEWTEKLVEGNYISFYGWGLGTFSYSTAFGGKQTIPAFRLARWRRG